MGSYETVNHINIIKDWFDIDRYQGMSQFSLNDWHQHLSRRHWMQGMLHHTSFNINGIQNYNGHDDLVLNQQKKVLEYVELIKTVVGRICS